MARPILATPSVGEFSIGGRQIGSDPEKFLEHRESLPPLGNGLTVSRAWGTTGDQASRHETVRTSLFHACASDVNLSMFD